MTLREIIYEIQDLSKNISDDTLINEEHILFLVNLIRANLLWQKYKSIKLEVPESNYQNICLNLTKELSNNCNDNNYLKSEETIPKLMDIGNTSVYPKDFYNGVNIVFIPRERMKYVGGNPMMRNIIYVSINPDGRLYLKSDNPQFIYMKQIQMVGVFEDSMLASEYDCNKDCELFDREFPLEQSLVTSLIDIAVKAVTSSLYKAADQMNNSNDDLADLANFIRKNVKSALQQQIEQ